MNVSSEIVFVCIIVGYTAWHFGRSVSEYIVSRLLAVDYVYVLVDHVQIVELFLFSKPMFYSFNRNGLNRSDESYNGHDLYRATSIDWDNVTINLSWIADPELSISSILADRVYLVKSREDHEEKTKFYLENVNTDLKEATRFAVPIIREDAKIYGKYLFGVDADLPLKKEEEVIETIPEIIGEVSDEPA